MHVRLELVRGLNSLLKSTVCLTLPVAVMLLAITLAACGEATPAPTAHILRETTTPATRPHAEPAIEVGISTTQPPAIAPSSTPTARPSQTASRPAPTQTPTPLPPTPVPTPAFPSPTPHPYISAWAKQRLDAVIALYRPTPAGAALLHSLDLRQMKGEPGFFGSYGFGQWAGVGEAKPVPTMHELMHSYWGGFPVIGRPELGWQRQEGEDIAPALAAYHRDILDFMAQPPDDYEMLRQRLRNLPGISGENTEPLFHSLEADLPYTTGGDLGLVPPILRKYWGYFLTDGPFHTWEQAAGWYLALSHDQRAVANKFLGFQHLDLREYVTESTYATPEGLLTTASRTLDVEELQRLTDLAEQFDLLLGDAQLEEDFQFWRGYLQDKLALYRTHQTHLDSLALPRARDISDALKFLSTLYGDPDSRASMLADRISAQPFLVNFLPAVDNPTLLKLFANDPDLPEVPTLQATASFVERLRRFSAEVDRVLADGRESPESGSRALEDFLDDTGFGHEQDLRLFFDLLLGADPATARNTMAAVDKETIRNLMPVVPAQLRAMLGPEGLLEKLDVTADAPEAELMRGIGLLIEETSGNYRIEEPFLVRLYEVVADRAHRSPGETARLVSETSFPLEGMILNQPEAAVAMLSADSALSIALVKGSDPLTAPPARIVYRLIAADPDLAATIVIALDQDGQREMAMESLAYLAYDKARSEKYPQLPISLKKDGDFLNSLLERQGVEWLHARFAESVALYGERASAGEVAPDFLEHYRETLEAAANSLDPEAGGRLITVIQALFG